MKNMLCNHNWNRYKKLASILLSLCAMCGWWSALYPQYTFVEDTYRIVKEDGSLLEQEEWEMTEADGKLIYQQILSADSSRIRMRSKLWEEFKALKRAGSERQDGNIQ